MISAVAAVHAGMCLFDRRSGFTVSDMQDQPTAPPRFAAAAIAAAYPPPAPEITVMMLLSFVRNYAAVRAEQEMSPLERDRAVRLDARRWADQIWAEAFLAGVAWQTAREPVKFYLSLNEMDTASRERLLGNIGRMSAGPGL